MTNAHRLRVGAFLNPMLTELKVSGGDVVGKNAIGQLEVLPAHLVEQHADKVVAPAEDEGEEEDEEPEPVAPPRRRPGRKAVETPGDGEPS